MHRSIPCPRWPARRVAPDLARCLLPLLLLLAGASAAADLPSWAEVQCPEVTYLIQDSDLSGARVQARLGRLDCMVLVAEAHRGRGDTQAAKEVLADVIGFAEDPQRGTYPLLLFYKVAYLNGSKADFSNLQQRDSSLAEQARQILVADQRDAILGYLRDPRDQACPPASLPFDDAGLDKLESVCKAATAWQQAQGQYIDPAALAEQLRLLDALVSTYSGQIYGQALQPPAWIAVERNRIEQDLACVTEYEQHFDTYNTARNQVQPLTAQRRALLAAKGAIQPCLGHLGRLGIDTASIDAALARVEQEIQVHDERMSARQRLEQEITEALQLDRIPPESRVLSWEQQLQRLPNGALSQPHQDTLRALSRFHQCKRDYPSTPIDYPISRDCEMLGFYTKPQPNGNRNLVDYDEALAWQLIRGSHLVISTEPPLTQAGRACELYPIFETFARESDKPLETDPVIFTSRVRERLLACGTPPSCISPDTMALARPHKSWVWTAFADCRLRQGNYKDAVENLDVAARNLLPDTETQLAKLIVQRLHVISELARHAGESGFDETGLRSKVGLRKSSVWLRDAFAAGPAAPSPSPSIDGPPMAADPRAVTPPASSSPPSSTGLAMGSTPADWYAKHWSQAGTLPYYSKISGADSPNIADVMASAEQARPELLAMMRYWDQRELGTSAAIGSVTVTRVVDRLRAGTSDSLDRDALAVTRSKERDDLTQELSFYPADFAVSHAIARRAIELGCPGIATQQLQPIGARHLDAVGPEMAELHQIVLSYVKARAGSPDACTGR